MSLLRGVLNLSSKQLLIKRLIPTSTNQYYYSKKVTETSSTPETVIDEINSNEDKYFEDVKKSFDSLRQSRDKESTTEKRSRLMYQSRKRGTLEIGLLLSNFASKHLKDMSDKELLEYDEIINNLHNEWELYYWLTDAQLIPEHLKDNSVLKIMKKYCANDVKEVRLTQPNLQ
jgi:succinate dehydrogenase assembly factor 2